MKRIAIARRDSRDSMITFVLFVFRVNNPQLPIEIPRDYTASDLDEEHRVAYWREDIGINLHHWHWHLVYPFETDIRIVNKDRRGELFYYMHHQIQAR